MLRRFFIFLMLLFLAASTFLASCSQPPPLPGAVVMLHPDHPNDQEGS